MPTFLTICVLVTLLKLCFINFYHSTDFEVHRNWMAITHSLPIGRWYTDATSPWTLDYPPVFAYFEWLLAQLARHFDPAMLDVRNLDYASPATVLFQRLSVIGADAVLMWGTWSFLGAWKRTSGDNSPSLSASHVLLLAGAVLGNVGLLLVDHIHFQYNGLLFGVQLLSIAAVLEHRIPRAAALFAVLLCAKHIFLYVAPVYGAYMLRFYVFGAESGASRSTALRRLAALAAIVAAIALATFAPFAGQLPELAARLFPFRRGLTHAYWAPNAWAMYNAADKVLALALGRRGGPESAGSAAGLVGEFEHAVLPAVRPWMTFVATVAVMAPCLGRLVRGPWHRVETPRDFVRALVLCGGASFLFGWHVHEKAVLMMVIPLSLLCLANAHEAQHTQFLHIVANYSLFPLLDTAAASAGLGALKYALWLLHASFMAAMVRRVHPDASATCRWFPERAKLAYLGGFHVLFAYEHFGHWALGLQQRLPFVPLMLCSCYCAIGVLWFYGEYYWRFMTASKATSSEPKQRQRSETKQRAKKVE